MRRKAAGMISRHIKTSLKKLAILFRLTPDLDARELTNAIQTVLFR
jgi:hypothetical protein